MYFISLHAFHTCPVLQVIVSREKNKQNSKFHSCLQKVYSSEIGLQTLKQACSQKEAQYAFKDLMTHGILQFALRIAFRCVLHRCKSQDIRR